MQEHKLTDRQERFIHEYLIDQNASAAALRAGYSAKTKGTQAAELMKDERIKARIAVELGDMFARLKVTAFGLLQAQAAAAFFDPAKLFDAERRPVPIDALDEATKSALTVHYDQRGEGPVLLRVRQTPRHVALAALVRRYEGFQKMQERLLAPQAVEAPVPAPAHAAPDARRAPPVLDEVPWRRPDWDGKAVASSSGGVAAVAQARGRAEAAQGQGQAHAQARAVAALPGDARAEAPAGEARREDMRARAQEDVQAQVDAGRQADAQPQARDAGSAGRARPDAPGARELEAARVAHEAELERDMARLLARDDKGAGASGEGQANVLRKARAKLAEMARQAARRGQASPARPAATQPRRDNDLLWGGRPKPTPQPEMKLSLMEHLAEVNRRAQAALWRGKIAPGSVVPGANGTPPPGSRPTPGFTRGPASGAAYQRPRYAIGKDEFDWSE